MAAVTQDKSAQISRFSYLLDNERFLGSAMLLPAIIFIIVLVGFPVVLAIVYAFSNITTGNPTVHFVGLETFQRVIADKTFQRALLNTIFITFCSQALVVILSNILALALKQNFRGKWFFRFLILLPWATPIALGAVNWLWMLDTLYSPIDWVLRGVGLLGHRGALLGSASNMYWLAKEPLALASIILVYTWRILPLATVINLAGQTSIPKDIQDAVAVDGVGFWREYFEVTLPLLRPIIAVAVLFGVIFTFTDMTVVYVLTGGGNNTQMLASWAFYKGIQGGDLAQGAAIALFFLPVLLAVVFVTLRIAQRSELT
jgi:multiple sugar transport system permease protein